jgi:hypothetical protein
VLACFWPNTLGSVLLTLGEINLIAGSVFINPFWKTQVLKTLAVLLRLEIVELEDPLSF